MTDKLILLSNENVLGPSPLAIAAAQQALGEMHLYSNDVEIVFLEALVRHHGAGLTSANFTSGNGSTDVLRMIVQAFMQPGANSVIAAPTFGIYASLTTLYGGTPIIVPLRDYTVDLPAMLAAVNEQTRLVFVCNPNNPTGTFVTHAALEAFLDQLPSHVTLVLDEAYREFADDPQLPRAEEWVTAGRNVIVSRTLSKLYGLAGLRAGYGFARPDFISRIRRYHQRHNSGRPTWFGAAAALQDHHFVARTLQMARASRAFYDKELPKLGIGYVPTQANFILLRDLPLPAAEIVHKAEAQGVVLNHTAWAGLPENVRITFARPHENKRVVETLHSIIN
jgi:histidinol-phosphate aminotransferase